MYNTLVFFGGKSAEHDISVITGIQLLENIDRTLYNVFPIYIHSDVTFLYGKNLEKIENYQNLNRKQVKKAIFFPNDKNLYIKTRFGLKKICTCDVAILCCHGLNGEDGTLQGLLELSDIPYTSSGVLSSSVSMDKVVMKRMFESLCLPVVQWQYLNVFEIENKKNSVKKEIEERVSKLNFPIIVKPANLGSSIGINFCNNLKETINAVNIAKEYDDKIILEEAVKPLKEINCSCLGDETTVYASELEEPISFKDFLTFDEKYLTEKSSKIKTDQNQKVKNKKETSRIERKFPAELSLEITEKIKNFSKIIFKEFCCKGVVRIDYLVNEKTNEVFVNEINSIPGSMSYYLWEEKYTYPELIDQLVTIAIKTKKQQNRKKFCYSSQVLNKYKNKEFIHKK